MPWPPAYNPVYHLHVRLPEPSLHANPLLQTPPVPHLEGLHTIQWLMSEPRQLSSTVFGDGLRFAFKDHDSGKLIPHLPVPLMAGPFLLDTLQGSKYKILFHQPNVLLDGGTAGVFQWGIAPPWRCIELRLPLPSFLAKAGRAAAARGSLKRLAGAQKKLAAAQDAQQAWSRAESLRDGMKAVRAQQAAEQGQAAAGEQADAALAAEQRRQAFGEFERRQRRWREAEQQALEEKRQYDRLSRRGRQLALQHDTDASAAAERAQLRPAPAPELADAREHRARAATVRQGSRAWAAEAEKRETAARAWQREAREARAAWRRAEEERARAHGKKENPVQRATGESNAGLLAPSLLAHVPFPATVEIRVSWSQIGKTWVAGLVGAAAEALKYYAGFVVDSVLAPGQGKVASFALDLVKSGINETLIDGGAKYLLEGTWPLTVSTKLGPVKVSASCQPDPATGTRKWKASLAHRGTSGSVVPAGNAKLSIEGHGTRVEKYAIDADGRSAEHAVPSPPVDYGHGIPAL